MIIADEYKVIPFLLSAAAVLFGSYCFYLGLTEKSKNPEDTESVLLLGVMMIAAGTLGPIVGGFIVRRFF